MIGVRLGYDELVVTASTDAHYSPDILDDLANAARRAIVGVIEDLHDDTEDQAEQAAPLTWNQAMRQAMLLDGDADGLV